MSNQQRYIAAILTDYSADSSIVESAIGYSAEYGGELPRNVVDWLRARGAEILRYVHRGVVSTVVNF